MRTSATSPTHWFRGAAGGHFGTTPRHTELLMQLALSRDLATGHTVAVPIYDYDQDRAVGCQAMTATGELLLIEGIFAFEVASVLREEHSIECNLMLLRASAFQCFVGRIRRDIREGRLGRTAATINSLRLCYAQGSYIRKRVPQAHIVVGRRDLSRHLHSL